MPSTRTQCEAMLKTWRDEWLPKAIQRVLRDEAAFMVQIKAPEPLDENNECALSRAALVRLERSKAYLERCNVRIWELEKRVK